MEPKDIKNCPFCGKDPRDDGTRYVDCEYRGHCVSVLCCSCYSLGPRVCADEVGWDTIEELALEAWNRRPE